MFSIKWFSKKKKTTDGLQPRAQTIKHGKTWKRQSQGPPRSKQCFVQSLPTSNEMQPYRRFWVHSIKNHENHLKWFVHLKCCPNPEMTVPWWSKMSPLAPRRASNQLKSNVLPPSNMIVLATALIQCHLTEASHCFNFGTIHQIHKRAQNAKVVL